jgi:hypothetical protein
MSNLHRLSDEFNKHTPKGFDIASNNTKLTRDERNQSRYVEDLIKERVENIVDGHDAPPTTTTGHLYLLIDLGNGSVDADWNGANYDDIVRVQDGIWVNTTPYNGMLVFNKTDEKYYKFGSLGWEEFGVGALLEMYNGVDVTPLTPRTKLRFSGYLEVVDDPINEESVAGLSSTALKESNVARFGINPSDEVDLKIAQNKLLTGDSNGYATDLTGAEGSVLGFGASNEVQEYEAIEVFNILKEEGITADKTMALVDISNISSNLKAKFAIFSIVAKNNTANAVTINIGSTSLGTDIVNAGVVGASSEVRLTVGTSFFSTTAGTTLYISSGSWNSANIDIHIQIQKVWQ